jgi:uncharacterized protein (DUF2252 family)
VSHAARAGTVSVEEAPDRIDVDAVLHQSLPSRADRRRQGKSVRIEVPLEAHASLPDGAARDAVALLREQDVDRVPELVPLRYARMAESPFAFLRGAAAPMAADLGTLPISGITVQLCGDAHAANFGIFAAPDRRMVFDVNDFDETLRGSFEWDVKRLAASVAVLARGIELTDKRVMSSVAAAVRAYRTTMHTLAAASTLDVWYARVDVDDLVHRLQRTALSTSATSARKKARRNSGDVAVAKLTEVHDGVRRFRDAPPELVRIDADDLEEAVGDIYARYVTTLPLECAVLLSRYSLRSAALRVVGVGSVGTRTLVVLLESGDGEPLILQLKQAGASVLERYLSVSRFGAAHGRRVVAGQRLLQAASDPFLGWADAADTQVRDFYVRQLRDMKGSIDAGLLDADALTVYGELCGGVLARAHARAGDASVIAGYLGHKDEFDQSVAAFALGYADITESDHGALLRDLADGSLDQHQRP